MVKRMTHDLQWLIAREQIRDLVHRYALAIDSRDWPAYRACFTDRIELDFSAATRTPPAWEPMPADAWVERCRVFFTRLTATQHIPALLRVDIDGAHATGCKQLHAQHYHEAFSPSVQLMTGRYDFEAHCSGEAWRFTRLKLHIGWEEGNRAVVDHAYGLAGS
jgi:hypothetical protein